MTLAPGTRLGPYELVGRIGAGGMGEVWKARDPKLDRFVAVKVLPGDFAADADRLRRFQQEARVLASLSHPNVVQVFEAGDREGTPFLVMELLEGETLRERLGKGRLPWRKAVEWAAAIADGLAAAHAKGIIHRDLKPENLVLTEHGHIKILDFGLAKLRGVPLGAADSRVDTAPPGTMDGALLGTVGYMSPEQVQGQPADARSDLFGLGCVLYELVTGSRAFGRNSAVETLAAILKDPVPEPSLANSGGTPELDRILGHCLEKDPSDRFHSAKDLAFDLRALLAVSSVASSGPLTPPAPGRRRPRWLLSAVGLVILLAAATGVLLWAPWKPAAPPWDARTVAILPFENRTGDPSLDGLGQQVADLIRQDLQVAGKLTVAAEQPIPAVGDAGRNLAVLTRARFIASGSFYLRGSDLEFQARLVDPWSGRSIYSLGPWRGPKADPAKPLRDLRQSLGGAVLWSFDNSWGFEPGTTRAPRLEASLVAYKAWQVRVSDWKAFVAGCEQALALDPDFFFARVDLLDTLFDHDRHEAATEVVSQMEADYARCTPVERCLVHFFRAYVEGRHQEALKALEDLRAIHPDTNVVRFVRAQQALALNRTGSAVRDLESSTPANERTAGPADYWGRAVLCWAQHQAGDYSTQLKLAREAKAAMPDVLDFYACEMAALAALGRLPEIDKVVEQLPGITSRPGTLRSFGTLRYTVLELRAHGHREAAHKLAGRLLAEHDALPQEKQKELRNRRANLLTFLDRPGEALEIMQTLAAEDPSNVYYPVFMAILHARLGRPEEARKAEAQLGVPTRPNLLRTFTYNRACIAAQLGEKDRAVALLRQAFGQGLAYGNSIHQDIDLEPLHGYPPYEELMKPKD